MASVGEGPDEVSDRLSGHPHRCESHGPAEGCPILNGRSPVAWWLTICREANPIMSMTVHSAVEVLPGQPPESLLGIQVSDVMCRLLGKHFNFIEEHSMPQLREAKPSFNGPQLGNLKQLEKLIDVSNTLSDGGFIGAFLTTVNSNIRRSHSVSSRRPSWVTTEARRIFSFRSG